MTGRRGFFSSFTDHFTGNLADFAASVGSRAGQTPPYADKQSVRQRDRALVDHACTDGLASLDRERGLRRQTSGIHRFHGHCVAQGSLETALACLEANREANHAGRIVNAVLDCQITGQDDPDFGNFRWMEHWQAAEKKEAVCYITPNLAALLERELRLLPDRQRIREALPGCRTALLRNNIPWTQTPVHLLTIWGLGICGKYTPEEDGGEAAAQDARQLWDDWFHKTCEHGVIEYNSPDALGIALFSLEGLWETVTPGQWKQEIELVLDYLTFELLCHTHPETGSLVGAMSRSFHGHLDGDGWTTFYAHRHFGTRRPATWPVWAMNFVLRKYRPPRWLHEFCWKRVVPYDVIEDHPHRTPHSPWPVRHRVRVESDLAVGSQTGTFFPPQEVPYLVSYVNPSPYITTSTTRDTVATGWRPENPGKPPWTDWSLSVSSDQTTLDTLLLLSFRPRHKQPERMEFVFHAGRADRVTIADEFEEESREHVIAWPRGFRIYTPGPTVGVWIYDPVSEENGERQTHSVHAEIAYRANESTLVISTRCGCPLVVPVLVVVRRERKKLPTEAPVAHTQQAGGSIVTRVSVPQTGALAASVPPTERPESVLHRSRFLTLRPGGLRQLAENEKRFQTLLTNAR